MISLIHYISFFCFVMHGHYGTPVNINPVFTYSEFLCHSSFVSLSPVPTVVSFSLWNLSTNTELTECCFRDAWYRQSMTVASIFNSCPKCPCGHFNYCWWNGPLENWFTEYENHRERPLACLACSAEGHAHSDLSARRSLCIARSLFLLDARENHYSCNAMKQSRCWCGSCPTLYTLMS